MRVFVTGATGFVGSAVVRDLLAAGHQVLGLTRSEAGAQSLEAMGAAVHRGDLDDIDSLQRGAAAADGVIHTAFNHDFSKYAANCEADRQVIAAMGAVLVGTNKPLVVTSGTAVVKPASGAVTEADSPEGNTTIPRVASELAVAALVGSGLRAMVLRLPPSVHGAGDHGFIPALINIAREKGVSAYIGDGLNRWPAVHRFDAAPVYRLALEKGTDGARFHAVADEGFALRDIATVIGRQLNLPVTSITAGEATAHFGWLAHFLALDAPASGTITKSTLNWQPTHSSLIADLEEKHYFE